MISFIVITFFRTIINLCLIGKGKRYRTDVSRRLGSCIGVIGWSDQALYKLLYLLTY